MPDFDAILDLIQRQVAEGKVRLTLHAQQEMADEDIPLDEVLQALEFAQILENYPEHLREACCLVYGVAKNGRNLHIVCTSAQPVLIIITVYEPKKPKWVTPTQRRPKNEM